MNPLSTQRHKRSPKDGNSGVRFQDSTAKVASVITGLKPLAHTKGAKGCSSCSK